MPSPIQDYALIGDGRTCALVSKSGSIDFLCWPRLDSDACFAALLGNESHGHWHISPSEYVRNSARRYRTDTPILETDHRTDTGHVRVTDFMLWDAGTSSIVRIVEGIAGKVHMAMSLSLRFGYGQIPPWTQRHENGATFEIGPDCVVLHSPIELTIENNAASARFTVDEGTKIAFILTYSPATAPPPPPMRVDAAVKAVEQEWTGWISRFEPRGRWDAAIKRSLITLRMLIDRESGGIVAAATLGLPEIPGGSANWDYRYCWLRDSTFTMTALLNAGFHREATRWRDWILRALGGDIAALQIVYRIDGGRVLLERELATLPGYQGATPVRVGNAAAGQKQLDVFGELMDSFDVLAKAGIARTPRVIDMEIAIVEHLEKIWDRPSADIWESRGDSQCFTYSQAMAWVGITRFVRAHANDDRVDPALIGRLGELGDVIHRTVCERGFNTALGHFVEHYGATTLDSSLLLLPLVGFLPIDDPRIAATIAAIEKDLMDGGLVRRKPQAPEGQNEGVFLACSCWLADCFKMQGRDSEAATLLDRVIGVANDVGLLSEEYDVRNRSLIGNIPQALTHLALVNTALFLSGPVIQRAGG